NITMKGLSADLTNVLEGLVKASNCIVVRDIVVKRADAPGTETTGAITPNQPEQAARSDPYARYGRQGLGGRMPGGMAQRYGYGLRPTPPPVTTPVPSGPKRSGTVVDEQKLEIVLSLDTVRLRPAPKVAKATTPATPLAQTGTESARP